MSEEHAADVGASGGGGTNKIVMIASLVNMVATLGIVAVLLLAHQKEKAAPSVDDIVKGQAKGKGGHGDAKAEGHGGGEHGGGEHGGGEHGGGHGGGGAPEEPVTDAGKIMALEPFTVNLTTGAGTAPRYVRMNVSVELEQGVPDKEFELKQPRVRDTIINLLNSKKPVELNTVEGREQVKDEIKKSLNIFMLQSKVKSVYFTNFAISN